MSIMTVILLSTTPIAGLGALLGMCRFEKWALEDRPAASAVTGSLGMAMGAPLGAPDLALEPETALQPQPLHEAA